MTGKLRKGAFAALILALVAGMAVSPAVATNSTINYDSSAAPQPEMTGDVTIADHPVGDDPLTYSDNNGDWVSLPGAVNSSADNPFEFTATDVAFDDAGEFPHSAEASALNDSLWTTDASSTAGTISVADTETAPGVDAVAISTESQTSGDTAVANFDLTQADVDSPITSDEEKRYLQAAMDINTLDSDAVVELRVVDEDGDYYNAEINSSRSSGEDWIAGATGEGIVYQQQLGELSLNQVGDGTFNDIESVEVQVVDGNADVEISALNVDKMGAWDFGGKLEDTDDDDELETVQIEEVKEGGSIAVKDLDTLGSTFDSANIKGLTVPFVMGAEDLDAEDVSVEFTDAEQYSNYESHFEGDFRFELPEAYDLSYANLELQDTVSVPGTRYVNVEYAEGTGDTAFDEISSWSDITGSYGSVGAEVSVDDTIQSGTAMDLSYDYVVTGEEVDDLTDPEGSVVGPTGDDGGIVDSLIGLPGLFLAAVVGVVQKIRGGFPFGGA